MSQKACEEYGIKKDSYYSGIKELIEKGYLIQIHNGSNHFRFYETPHKSLSEDDSWFSEDTIIPSYSTNSEHENKRSKKTILESDSQKTVSENLERNNTDNTIINKNNTIRNLKGKELSIRLNEANEQWKRIKDFEQEMTSEQRKAYLIASNLLYQIPVVYVDDYDKRRRIEIIDTAYRKIFIGEVK